MTEAAEQPCLQSGEIMTAVFAPRITSDLKDSAIPLVGRRGEFQALWVIEDGDYLGEWAMQIPRDWPIHDAFWVPDGDLMRVIEGSEI